MMEFQLSGSSGNCYMRQHISVEGEDGTGADAVPAAGAAAGSALCRAAACRRHCACRPRRGLASRRAAPASRHGRFVCVKQPPSAAAHGPAHRACAYVAERAGTRWGGTGRKAERGSGSGSEYSEEDEENMKKMKKERVLPFDKGASEFVPTDMQPANEWQTLKETFLFDWPLLETPQFALKVASCFGFWFLFSLPIASETWSADSELAPRILAAVLGGAIPSLLILLRLFFGVKMVSDRLGQDAVYFESDERRPTTAVDLQVSSLSFSLCARPHAQATMQAGNVMDRCLFLFLSLSLSSISI